jgi:signal peptidase I
MTLETAPSLMTADTRPPIAKRRRWWLAAILSIFVPGLGQLYAICPKRAAWMLAVVTAIHVSLGLILGYVPPVRLETIIAAAVLALLIVVIRLYSAVDAAVIAWTGGTPELRSYNRLSVYLLILFGWTAASHFGLAGARSNGLVWQPYVVTGESMAPTLRAGDSALGCAGYYRDHAPTPGEVAVVALADGGKALSRVIAGPGAEVALSDGRLEVDGHAVARETVDAAAGLYRETLPQGAHYLVHAAAPAVNLATIKVPANNYLVVGDNRDLATARIVPAAELLDRVSIILYSRDTARIGNMVGP